MYCAARLRDAVGAEPRVRLAVLFGSAARGGERATSDLDVGVQLEPRGPSLASLAVTLSRAAGREVDLVSLDEAPPLLRFEIAREGVVLVERKPFAWADFRARAMIDWWDWAPTARIMHSAALARMREGLASGPA